MSRLQRTKDALALHAAKMRDRIVKSQSDGKVPADYSLGFTNGLIFSEHYINMRDGDPTLFERTTSVGALPCPVALRSGNAIRDERTYQYLLDTVLLKARNMADCLTVDGDKITIADDFVTKALTYKKSIESMDQFITEQEDFHAQQKEEALIQEVDGGAGGSLAQPDACGVRGVNGKPEISRASDVHASEG